jgi:hypothetical protein
MRGTRDLRRETENKRRETRCRKQEKEDKNQKKKERREMLSFYKRAEIERFGDSSHSTSEAKHILAKTCVNISVKCRNDCYA